jgi:surface carbohydrate biosynthesis protein
MKLIYIPVEVKTRELLSKLFFIANNIDEKFIFFIGDKMSTKNAVSHLGKGIYFYKSINWYDDPHIERVKKLGNCYISLDEEGGVTQSNIKNFQLILNRRSSKKNVILVDKVFAWGDFDYNGWCKKYNKFKHKIVKSGSPRFDLWRSEVYSKIFKKEILHLKKYSPYFFIPSTFINSQKWLAKEILHEKNMYYRNDKESISFLKQRIKQNKDSYKNFLYYVDMIKKLTKSYPDHNIIIKPHPKEDIYEWKKRFNQKYSNVIVDNKYDMTSYIAASECVIFTESIAGMQSIVMGKKTICYNLKNISTLRNFANKCAPQTKSYENLLKYIKKNLKKDQLRYGKKIYERFYIKKKTASKIIMHNLKKLKISEINMNNFYLKVSILGFYYTIIESLKHFLININGFFFKKTQFKSYSVKMPGGISRKEVDNFFRKFDFYDKVKIINFGKNGYIILKKFN